eukprot:5230601-Amphidinium_carterae.2
MSSKHFQMSFFDINTFVTQPHRCEHVRLETDDCQCEGSQKVCGSTVLLKQVCAGLALATDRGGGYACSGGCDGGSS